MLCNFELNTMKRLFLLLLLPAMGIIFISCTENRKDRKENIVIENEQVRLIISHDGTAESLVFKPMNEECLRLGENISLFSVTQERPYNNEVKLAHPNKKTTYRADTVYRLEDNLIVGFETIPYEAVIKVKVAAEYLRFSLEDFIVEEEDYRVNITPPPVYVVYWHISDNKKIALALNAEQIILLESLGQEVPVLPGQALNSVILPVGKRRYIKTSNLTRDQMITAFQNAIIIP